MIYTALPMLFPLLCQVFFTRLFSSHPLNCILPCCASQGTVVRGAGVAGGADVLPEPAATAQDKRKGGEDGCSVCAQASEREMEGGREREGTHDFPACKSLSTMKHYGLLSLPAQRGEEYSDRSHTGLNIVKLEERSFCFMPPPVPRVTEAPVPKVWSLVSKRIWMCCSAALHLLLRRVPAQILSDFSPLG